MGRRLSSAAALGVVVAALGLGSAAGLILRPSQDLGASGASERPSGAASGAPSVPSTTAPPTAAPTISVLSAANVLSAADLAGAGWAGVRLDSVGDGTAQFAKICQQREPSAAGIVTAVYSDATGEFGQQSAYSFDAPPQAGSAYRAIVGVYAHCGTSAVTRLRVPAGITGGVWHVTGGEWGDGYAVVVRAGDRIGWASLDDTRGAVDPASVPALAAVLEKRLRN